MSSKHIDVHQHLWPTELIEALRARLTPPMLRSWTLHTAGEAPFEVHAADHDVAARAKLEQDTELALVSLSTPLGIEALPDADSMPLLQAWHAGAAALPAPFAAWAAVSDVEPDLAGLDALLTAGFVGLQVSANRLASPAAVEALAPVLRVCERRDRPVLIHPGPPGPSGAPPGRTPSWWPAVVDYPGQLARAWWAWQVAGRRLLPGLRICFAAGAGLAPAHHERFSARGGGQFIVDPDVYVDTSSYARQGLDVLTRALGVDVIVLGSDRPYAEPAAIHLGPAARDAICLTNPRRLLGATPR